jgi:hypothetical protein
VNIGIKIYSLMTDFQNSVKVIRTGVGSIRPGSAIACGRILLVAVVVELVVRAKCW